MIRSVAADAEVVVVGAGPAGAALATMLGRAGVETVVVDRATFPRDKPCGEGLMPAGVAVLERLGLDLEPFPRLTGVMYRVPRAGSARGDFLNGKTGRGARRVAFDAMLAECARATPRVAARFGCEVTGFARAGAKVSVETSAGTITARSVVGADGLHSQLARWTGRAGRPRQPHRYAFVGHAEAPAHGVDSVLVTILERCEVYTAPTTPDELLVAVLGTKAGLRREGESASAAYRRHVGEAHPDLPVAEVSVRGAGPFWTRSPRVAGDGVFLIGDAAGFLDPLTGDGMSDALVAAEHLAPLIASHRPDADRAYTRWEAGQWRRRVFVSRLAKFLTGSPAVAARAVRGLEHRPATLDRLLEVNDGARRPWSLSLRDWAALAGF